MATLTVLLMLQVFFPPPWLSKLYFNNFHSSPKKQQPSLYVIVAIVTSQKDECVDYCVEIYTAWRSSTMTTKRALDECQLQKNENINGVQAEVTGLQSVAKKNNASNVTIRIKLSASGDNYKALDKPAHDDTIHTETRNTFMFFCTAKLFSVISQRYYNSLSSKNTQTFWWFNFRL